MKDSVRIRYLKDGIQCEACCGELYLGVPYDMTTRSLGASHGARWVRSITKEFFAFKFPDVETLVQALVIAEQSRIE